jgi:heme/copper-type cytochrome/quinol oxidase subunit 3
MQNHELYLPMLLPLWGIFIGIALVIIGFVDKKPLFTYLGWFVLILNGLISLYYNLFQIDALHFSNDLQMQETAKILIKTGWLNVSGAILALASVAFFYLKKRRYVVLACLTILFFSIQFFQYYSLLQKPK